MKETESAFNETVREKGKSAFLILLLSFFFLFSAVVHPLRVDAARVRVVEGLIQDVTETSIEVRGRYYVITGVPLLDPSGNRVRKDLLKKGKKVEIYFEDGAITSVLVHNPMSE